MRAAGEMGTRLGSHALLATVRHVRNKVFLPFGFVSCLVGSVHAGSSCGGVGILLGPGGTENGKAGEKLHGMM